MIELVGLDFDGTIINWENPEQPHVNTAVFDEIENLIKKGIIIGLVTGRQYADIVKAYESYGYTWGKPFPCFIVCREVFIYYSKEGQLVSCKEWNLRAAESIKNLVNTLKPRMPGIESDLKEKKLEPKKIVYRNKENDLWGMEFWFENAEQARFCKEYLKTVTMEYPEMLVERNGPLAYITTILSGKGKNLQKIVEYYKKSPESVLAVGDSDNDISMLDGGYGFHGATVGNADFEVKNAVTKNNGFVSSLKSSDGVLEILKQYCKSE